MTLNIVTFWLYYNNQPLTAIRLPDLTPDHEVRNQAIQSHQRIPLCMPEAPGTFETMLQYAEIRL